MFECQACGREYESPLVAKRCAEYDDLVSD